MSVSKYSLFVVFILLKEFVFSQTANFENITIADGLTNSVVHAIGQDKYGFIWIGTQDGLNIYDGIRFRQYYADINDKSGLIGNQITDFAFEGDSVWIATRSGLCKMDIKTKRCKRYPLGNNNELRTLFFEKENHLLWIGTVTGLVRLNTKTGQYHEYNTQNSNISNNIIRAIYKDLDNNLWIGTFDKLNLLKNNSEVFETIILKRRQLTNIKYNLILSIHPYEENNDSLLWIGTETGLALYNRRTGEMNYFHEENSGLPNSVIKSIQVSGSGDVWLGTDFGLGRIKENNEITAYFHDLNEDNSLINNTVWEIFEDNSGTLWFGTNNGISIFSRNSARFQFVPVTYQHEQNLIGYEINDIIETSGGDYWIGSQDGAIKYNSEMYVTDKLNSAQKGNRNLADDNVSRLFEDTEGNIWIASNGGLAIWNEKEEKLTRYSADNSSGKGLRSNFISSFHRLNDGTMLINTQKGLHKVIQTESGIEFSFIRVVNLFLELSGDYLWSFVGANLYKIDIRTFEQQKEVTFTFQDKEIQIESLLFTDENNLWLGEKNGLIHYNLQSGEYAYHEIRSNRNYPLISLLADDIGNIWASSFSAVLKFSPVTKDFEIYPSGNEIPINPFNRRCAFRSKNGDLIFGGQDGFIRFNPKRITKSEFVAPVVFTRLIVSNREVLTGETVGRTVILKNDIAFSKEIELLHSNKSFSIEFSSLHFGNREAMRYAYKLEGFDSDWHYTNGHLGTVTYSNLNAGRYTLKVKGTNREGVWSSGETSLKIRIKPPLWANPWFILIYFLFLVTLIWGMIKYYRNRTKIRNQLNLARMEKKHAEELVKTRQQFFTNISHEFRTPLSLIIGPAEKLEKQNDLNETTKEYVRIIEKNARRLLWLNNQLLDFRKVESKTMTLSVTEFDLIEFARNIFELFLDKADRKKINYQFTSGFDQLNVHLDARKTETIFFNLLSNAFKFTPSKGKITVRIGKSDFGAFETFNQGVEISVTDSGMGIAEQDKSKIFERFYQTPEASKMERGSGIGLTMVKEYVEMLRGKIEVESKVGEGSAFRIHLPVYYSLETDIVMNDPVSPEEILAKNSTKSNVRETRVQIPDACTILIVEDDDEISDFITLGFNNKYNIRTARNGKEALTIIAQHVPDLVISDIIMPEMDGLEFTKQFKSNPKTAHIPLILLTGQSDQDTQLKGMKTGADAFVVKPFDFELLEANVNNFIKRQDLFSAWIKVNKLSEPNNATIATADEKILEKIVSSIEKYISDPDLNIDKVCADTGFSHPMLYRKVKSITGQTLNEFIRMVRIRRAEQLLRTKRFSVAEVMYETGFTNHSYFSKCFRKVYKATPKEYIANR